MSFEEIKLGDETENDSCFEADSLSEINPLAEVVTIQNVFKHPNADALELISPDGSNVSFAIARLGQFKAGDRALWLDSVNEPMVPTENPIFAHMSKSAKEGYARIRGMRLRGEMSRGLLVSFDPAWSELSNLEIVQLLNIKKFIPANNSVSGRRGGKFIPGNEIRGPVSKLATPKYDVESLSRGWRYVPNGTEVFLTEKIHGANASYGFLHFNGEVTFWSRSRTQFKKAPNPGESGGLWWDVAKAEDLETKLKDKVGIVVMGEVFGQVQDLKYGVSSGARLAVFDIWDSNESRYFSWPEVVKFCEDVDLKTVPEITRFVWNTDGGIPAEIVKISNGQSIIDGANNIREGFVLRADITKDIETYDEERNPVVIRRDVRLIYKLVGNDYLTRK